VGSEQTWRQFPEMAASVYSLTPAQLARRGYGSFATAWQVKKDFETLHSEMAS